MRNVIVTGGTRGIGLAISLALVAEGYQVIAVARTETAPLLAAIDSASESGTGCLNFRACDLSRTSELAGFVGALRKEFGPVYGLVNNAGIGTAGILSLMPDDQVEALVRLNTISPILMTKYVLRSMMVAGHGRIINMASIVATTGYSGLRGVRGDQSGAAWIHPFPGARGRAARHYGKRHRAGIHRYRIDPRTRCGAARTDCAPQCPAASGRHR